LGRQIDICLAWRDEQLLFDQASRLGLQLLPSQLVTPNLIEEAYRSLPPDDLAKPYEFFCALIPRELCLTRQASLANSQLPRPYYVGVDSLPCIEWTRTTGRNTPHFSCRREERGRLYIATQRDYGEDQRWMQAVTKSYVELAKFVKSVTRRVADGWPVYVSPEFEPKLLQSIGRARALPERLA
jgi:hypothetical protein